MWGRLLRFCIVCAVLASGTLLVIGQSGSGHIAALCSPWAYQCTVLAGASVVLTALVRSWVLCALAAIVLAGALRVTWQPAGDAPTLVAANQANAIRIVMANVNAGLPPDAAQLEWLNTTTADIVAIVECTPAWAEAVRTARSATMQEVSRAKGDRGGIALFSRFPLLKSEVRKTPTDAFPFIDVTLDHPSGPIRLLVVHPLPPSWSVTHRMRNDELAWLATQCAAESGPLIVIGDFNETMYGWAYGEFLRATGLKNARNGFGRQATWPSMIAGVRIPDLLRIPIDHCFVSPQFAVESFAIGVEGISDHAPIDVRVVRLPSE